MGTGEIILAAIGASGSVFSFFVGRGLKKAEASKTSAEAVNISVATTEKAVAIWEELNKNLHSELEILRDQVNSLKEENEKLHRENMILQKQIMELVSEVEKLKKLVA